MHSFNALILLWQRRHWEQLIWQRMTTQMRFNGIFFALVGFHRLFMWLLENMSTYSMHIFELNNTLKSLNVEHLSGKHIKCVIWSRKQNSWEYLISSYFFIDITILSFNYSHKWKRIFMKYNVDLALELIKLKPYWSTQIN